MSFAFKDLVVDREVNLPNQIVPKMYMEQHENIYWICDKDEAGNITSVFFQKGNMEDKRTAMVSEAEVLDIERQLVANGWVKCKRPEITFN